MLHWTLIGLIVLDVMMVLAIPPIVIHRNLPGWKQEPGSFWEDLKETAFAANMIWLFIGWVPVFFSMFATSSTYFVVFVGLYVIAWLPVAATG